jgi:tetratricopeptide (TPR) repeat protein
VRYHNLDFLVNAYLQLGQDRRAKAIVDERNSIAALPAGTGMTAQTGYAALAVRYAFERGDWKAAAALAPMNTSVKPADAIIWFARAVGSARSGELAAAKSNIEQLSRIRGELAAAGDPYWTEQVGIEEAAASAWVAFGEHRTADAVKLLQDAAEREDHSEKHIAMENRLSPMREMLGELLLEANQPKEALREFESSLHVVPNRFRSLAGAAAAAEKMNNRRQATSYYKQLLVLTAKADSERPAVAHAKTYLNGEGR